MLRNMKIKIILLLTMNIDFNIKEFHNLEYTNKTTQFSCKQKKKIRLIKNKSQVQKGVMHYVWMFTVSVSTIMNMIYM